LKYDKEILKAVRKHLGDSYEFIRPLGEGATSKVYLVYQKYLKQYRALKIMDYEYIYQSLVKGNVADSMKEFNIRRKRFIREANAYKKIKDPNVAEIYDIHQVKTKREDIKIPYIIMQYVEGEPLSDLLKSKKSLPLETAAVIAVNILDALEVIHHEGIIHRDIKPSNIIIEKGTKKAIIIDFGLAKDMTDGTQMTTTGMQMGTKLYMSPEQFKDSSKVGPGTDIYSFGVILYQMLTGKPPYEGSEAELMYNHIYSEIPDIKKMKKDLPGVIDTLIRKSMAKEEKNRENTQYYKRELEIFIKKPAPGGGEPGKKSDPVFKSRHMKKFAYAAVFIITVMISYFLYFSLIKGSGKSGNISISTHIPISNEANYSGEVILTDNLGKTYISSIALGSNQVGIEGKQITSARLDPEFLQEKGMKYRIYINKEWNKCKIIPIEEKNLVFNFTLKTCGEKRPGQISVYLEGILDQYGDPARQAIPFNIDPQEVEFQDSQTVVIDPRKPGITAFTVDVLEVKIPCRIDNNFVYVNVDHCKPALALVVFITNTKKAFLKQEVIDKKIRPVFAIKPYVKDLYVGWVSYNKTAFQLNEFINNNDRQINISDTNINDTADASLNKIIKYIEKKFTGINVLEGKKQVADRLVILLDKRTISDGVDYSLENLNVKFIDINDIINGSDDQFFNFVKED